MVSRPESDPGSGLVLRLLRPGPETGFRYRFAGQPVICDRRLAVARPAEACPLPESLGTLITPRAGLKTFDDSAWLAGRKRPVAAWWDDSLGWIETEPGLRLALDVAAGESAILGGGEALGDLEATELALGPMLLPLLACRDTFVLHASAVRVAGRLLAILGASGAGKSTLADASAPEWERRADDLAPIRFEATSVSLFTDYPQLKLPSAILQEPPAPLATVVVLAGVGSAASPTLRPLHATETAAALLGHCAGASLLRRRDLATYFELASRLSTSMPAFQLSYPRDLEQLPRLRKLVTELASGLPRGAL